MSYTRDLLASTYEGISYKTMMVDLWQAKALLLAPLFHMKAKQVIGRLFQADDDRIHRPGLYRSGANAVGSGVSQPTVGRLSRSLSMQRSNIYEKNGSPETHSHTLYRNRDTKHSTLRILLVGPYPEPVGGVSIHISRLYSWLKIQHIVVELIDEARQRKIGIYNIRSMRFLSYFRHLAQCNVVHIQSSVHLFRIFHIVMCRFLGLRVIVTIHAWNSGNFVTFFNRLFLTLAHKVILVNKDINNYLKLGDYQVLPAFLPPDGCRQDLPEEIMSFIAKARARGCPLLCANAYQMMEYKDQDLYGLDLCVELINHLTYRSDVEAALVFVVSRDAKGNQLYANAQKVIKDRGLEDRFCLYNRPIDFVALMTQCDLVLRPTNTDGDALTIREALYLGLPVIASDAVRRPPGTILFKNRDVKDLFNHTVEILKAAPRRTCSPIQTDSDTYFKQYLDLYIEVLKSDGHPRRLREVPKRSDAKV